jgi:hypothetical protein
MLFLYGVPYMEQSKFRTFLIQLNQRCRSNVPNCSKCAVFLNRMKGYRDVSKK